MSADHKPALSTEPPLLRIGDLVRIVAPSGPLQPERLARGQALLESWGLRVEVAASARAASGHGHAYLAGDDDLRLTDITDGLVDPEVKAVLCGRGGYGCNRILPGLSDFVAAHRREPGGEPGGDDSTSLTTTAFLGSSDVTALLPLFYDVPEVTGVFAPMVSAAIVADDPVDQATVDALHTDLFGSDVAPMFGRGMDSDSTTPVTGPHVTGSTVTGPLVGGTLSLLCALLGGPHHPTFPSGAIVAIEDVSEPAFRIDRMLTSLLQAEVLSDVGGIATGSLMGPNTDAEYRAVILERLGGLNGRNVPIVTGLPFGHGRPQRSLWLGRDYVLDAAAGSLARASLISR